MPALCLPPDPARRRALATAALGLLAGAPLRAQPRPERTRLTLALGGKHTLYYLPVLLAAQLGYFRDEGLTVELQDHPGGGPAVQAVIGGHADLAAGAYEHAILLRQRGLNFRAFALLGRAPQTVFGLATPGLADARTLHLLRGQRVGISAPESATQWFARLVLARAGLAPEEVQWVGVGTAASAGAALREGRIDALANVDPVISQLEFGGHIRVAADARSLRGAQQLYGGPMPGGCLYAPQGFVLRYPNTVQALANAVVRALKWLQTAGPSDIVRGVPESAMSGDRAIYLAALDKVREAFSPDGVLGEEAVQTAHRLVAQQAQAQAAVRAAAPAATYTNEFVLRARQRFAA